MLKLILNGRLIPKMALSATYLFSCLPVICAGNKKVDITNGDYKLPNVLGLL